MTRRVSLVIAALMLLASAFVTLRAAQVDERLYSGLAWRNIGPFRAGRVSAVTGVIGQPGVFYMGLPLGGVWKTTSAGETWFPVFDAVKDASSVGSIEVAPSDPNVIYVGMGDLITGGGINEGNGVYKSVDAGRTWQHLGLDDTKQIPSVLVDPKNADVVLIAAQGNVHTHTEERGVFRSTDGGRTWKKTLFVNDETGIQKLAWAHDRPQVILATTVKHYNAPGIPPARGVGPGATPPGGTALYKSVDEGVTWSELNGGGLPALAGRTSVAIAANTNALRMFLIGPFGLYRSDDAGVTWRQVAASDRRIVGSGYICDVYVDPKNPDIVYVMNTSSYRSTDGGNTFTGFKGAPGGDDPHVLWIDPTDSKRMFLGVDQGATISLDGGETWSSWYNQITGQVYHVSTDTQFPYWVYATQQDSGSIGQRSRGDLGQITFLDWLPTPGYEFGYILADPLNPHIVYAGGPSAGIVKITYPSGQWINVSPNVETGLALRKVTNQPMLWLPQNLHELLVGFQYVMSTIDGGLHWKKLSPDLGYPKGVAPPPPGTPQPPPDGRAGGPPPGGSIESMSASTVAAGTIWVGTNNGLIKITKDHGLRWDDVSIPDLPNATHADVSIIDSSHHDAGTAYAAIDYHVVGDYKPYFYRTRDYGKTWTKIVNGLPADQPSGSFARVIRADTTKRGLLFAGTESSVYVSFDDGDSWQTLMLNLPNTSYRDFAIHGNDLVAGTYGRGFWILDDYAPLRQITPALASEEAHLFKPSTAVRVRRNVNGDTPFPPEVPHAPNPPLGAILYYYLREAPKGPVSIDITDPSGQVVRHLSSAPVAPFNEPPAPIPDFWIAPRVPIVAAAGTNRVNWDIRYDEPPAFTHNYAQVMGAVKGDTPSWPEGPLALPGVYTVKLTADGRTYTETLSVKNDPRSPANAADLLAQHALQMKVYDGAKQAWDAYQQIAVMRNRLTTLGSDLPTEVKDAVSQFEAKLTAVAGTVPVGRGGFAGAGAQGPPTFVRANGTMIRQLETLDSGDMAPTGPMLRAYTAACGELAKAVSTWRGLNGSDLDALNRVLESHELKPLGAASPLPAVPACAAPAAAKSAGPKRRPPNSDRR